MCAGRVTLRRIVGIKEGGGKGRKCKKGQGKGTEPKGGDAKKKGVCHKCGEVGRKSPKKKEGGVHCLTYTYDRSHWNMMLAEVGPSQKQSNNIEFLDSGVACHAWQCKTKLHFVQGLFLTVTRAPIASQGTLDVRATLELLLVRRPILSVNRLVEKRLAVVMGNTLSKDGRVRHLHKSNGYAPRPLSELCPLEDQDPRNDDAPPAKAVGEANVSWKRRLPCKPTEGERLAHSISQLSFRAGLHTL